MKKIKIYIESEDTPPFLIADVGANDFEWGEITIPLKLFSKEAKLIISIE